MNNQVTSKEEILKEALNIVSSEGIGKINMRNVANKCGVALGSLYNYYPSKEALLMDVVKYVWDDIFNLKEVEFSSLTECIEALYSDIQTSLKKYPHFLNSHAKINNKAEGVRLMFESYYSLKMIIVKTIEKDSKVDQTKFDDVMTKEVLANYIFTLFIDNINDEPKKLISFVNKYIY